MSKFRRDNRNSRPVLLGVDTGGAFTDFGCLDSSGLRVHKLLSTPAAPEQAVLQGIRDLALEGQYFYLVHGSTVATNAVLEGKGVATAYITNRGLGDVLTLGRQARPELYNLARGRQLSLTLCLPVTELEDERIEQHLQTLQQQGRQELLTEGVSGDDIAAEFSLDLRYQGQNFSLNVVYTGLVDALEGFQQAHQRRFGHTLETAVELVNIRVSLSAAVEPVVLGSFAGLNQKDDKCETVVLIGEAQPVPLRRRDDPRAGQVYNEPMLVVDAVATTLVAAGWCAVLHANGCLILQRAS